MKHATIILSLLKKVLFKLDSIDKRLSKLEQNDNDIEDVMSKFAMLVSKYNISEEDAKNFLHPTLL